MIAIGRCRRMAGIVENTDWIGRPVAACRGAAARRLCSADANNVMRHQAIIKSAALALVVLATGCATQSNPPHDPDLAVYSDARLMSSKQWEVYQPERQSAMASVVADARDASASVLCDGKGGLSIQLNSHDGRALKKQSLTVAFDQGAAADYPWYTNTEDGWNFILLDDQTDFRSVIADLKMHKTLEAVVSESGKEWRRYQFTLAKADAAIDYVLKLCGKP